MGEREKEKGSKFNQLRQKKLQKEDNNATITVG